MPLIDSTAGTVAATYTDGTQHTVLALGTHVRATYHDGSEVQGVIVSRDWWFERFMFYTVREHATKQRWGGMLDEWNIYPGRDAIEAVSA